MALPTVAVAFIAHDQNGNPVAGARVQARLDQTEIYQGFVVPEVVEATADATGAVSLDLWPNELGVAGSAYQVRAWNPDTGKKFLDARAVVPNANCNLYQILVQEPYPPIDASERALIDAQAAALSAQEDRVQTGLDRIQTGLDRVQTGEDRVQTGEDRQAAETARLGAEDALDAMIDVGNVAQNLQYIRNTSDNMAAVIAAVPAAEAAADSAASADYSSYLANQARIASEAARDESVAASDESNLRSQVALNAQLDAKAQAGIATTQATLATTEANRSAVARAAAEVARDAAFVNANVYANKAAGLAATSVGGQFQVVENIDLVRYRVDAGPVAVEVARVKQSPKGSEIVWPTVLGTPTGWIDTGIRLAGAACDRALLTNTDPSILFDGSVQGVWFDPSDLSTMFQDVAGTIPVTTPGQTVALLKDKSGKGNHFSQSNASWRPVYQVDAEGRAYLDMAGKGMTNVTKIDWTGTNKVTVFAGLRKNSDAAFGAIFESATSLGGLAFGLSGPLDASGGFTFYSSGPSGASGSSVKTSAYLGTVDAAIVCRGDIGASVSDIQMDNGDRSINTSKQGIGYYSKGDNSYFGGRVASYGFFNGRVYQFIIAGFAVDATKAEIVRRYCAAKAKVGVQQQPGILPFVLSSFSWKDSAAAKTGFFDIPSCFAHVDFTTSANLLQINGYCTMDVAFPNASQDYIKEIGVYVNGVFHAAVNTTTDGPFTRYVSLPSGSKTVSVVVGPQSVPSTFNSYPLGTFVQSIAADAPMTIASPSAANRLLIYGDSIAAGDAATNPTGNGWAMKVRQSLYPRSVAVEAHGYRSLYEDAFDATARAAFVAKLASFSPSEIWLAIGTNDYGLNKWNAASFGTAYAALLDDLHTALPSAHIYCQTPIARTNSGANGSGSTLADYRTQITTAVSTRTAYAELVDGTAILLTSDLSDGVHPTTAGHAKYATYALGVLA